MHSITKAFENGAATRTTSLALVLAAVVSAGARVISAQPADGLAPLVVINDIEDSRSVDWSAARLKAGTDYPNRWDDLTLLDTCYWLTTGEVEEGLELSIGLNQSKQDFRCFCDFDTENFIPSLLSLHVEVHRDTAFIREVQTSYTEGFARLQFDRVDVGTPELDVFVRKNGSDVYVFPNDGMSMWRLGVMEERRFQRYDLPIDYSEIENFGVRYIQLLVEKFANRL